MPPSRRRWRAACPSSPPTRRCSPRMAWNSPNSPSAAAPRSPSRPRSAAASPSSRPCARRWPATASQRVSGILNGTCNYILSQMETERLPFEVCLEEAQRLGYAEADPTFDVGGFDTAHKLSILASLAFGARVDADAVSVEGIETITLADLAAADELGFRIKLLGVAARTDHGVEQRVHPTMVAQGHAARADHGRAQRRDDRRRRRWRADAGRPRRRRRRHRLGGRRRSRRHRARRGRARLRPPRRRARRGRARLAAAPRGRLLRAAVGARPPGLDGDDRQTHGRSRDFAGVDRAEARRRRSTAPMSRSSSSPTRPRRPRSARRWR